MKDGDKINELCDEVFEAQAEIARLRALVAAKDEALRQFANKANWIHPAPDEWHWGFKRDFAPETIAKAALDKE